MATNWQSNAGNLSDLIPTPKSPKESEKPGKCFIQKISHLGYVALESCEPMASLWHLALFRLVFSTLEINKASSTSLLYFVIQTAESHTPSPLSHLLSFLFQTRLSGMSWRVRAISRRSRSYPKHKKWGVSLKCSKHWGDWRDGFGDWGSCFFACAKNANSPASPCWLWV